MTFKETFLLAKKRGLKEECDIYVSKVNCLNIFITKFVFKVNWLSTGFGVTIICVSIVYSV